MILWERVLSLPASNTPEMIITPLWTTSLLSGRIVLLLLPSVSGGGQRQSTEFRDPGMNVPTKALISINAQFQLSCKKMDDKSDKGEGLRAKMIIQSTYLHPLWLAIINMYATHNVMLP